MLRLDSYKTMRINAEFDDRVIVRSEQVEWLPSPMKGVRRRPLDRVGGEVARATSIVEYAPGSHFSAHVHGGGEEFIVLDGVFQDETGDFPAGSYVRNPPTSSHTPRAEPGCTIFVKLWQFDPEDRQQITVQMNDLALQPEQNGVSGAVLFENACETVKLVELDPGVSYRLGHADGFEVFVLSGSVSEQGDELTERDWLRLPLGTALDVCAGKDGARLWVKSGHLATVAGEIERVISLG